LKLGILPQKFPLKASNALRILLGAAKDEKDIEESLEEYI
jgi:hypothetical protein